MLSWNAADSSDVEMIFELKIMLKRAFRFNPNAMIIQQ